MIDDAFQAESILLLCEQCKYKDVRVASSGEEAIAIIRRDKSINLVLSDVTMESMSDGCCGQGLFTPLAVNR